MDKETREEIVLHTVRWVSNILAEVLSNHGESISEHARLRLREAFLALEAVDSDIRFQKLQELSDEAQEQGRYDETTNPLRKQ